MPESPSPKDVISITAGRRPAAKDPVAVSLPVIARNEAIRAQATTRIASFARNEAIREQATTRIASFVAMTGEIQCTKK
ncbi:MAG: hypothetical protein LBJ47_04190 [Tannerella sp.]|nr:hypothetical protein [Tannerella sp.]